VSQTASNSTLGKLFVVVLVVLALFANAPDARAQNAEAAPPAAGTAQDYGELLRQTGSLNTYNRQMERLVASQRKEMATIEEELTRIDDVSQGIMPLMLRMVEALEAFVELDIPFNIEERRERIAKLRVALDAAKLSQPDRYRRILQAYQIENEYGRSIEAYRSTLERDGRELTVDYLRVGRTALIYQTLDESEAGVWNREDRRWESLDGSHRSAIRRGLRIARRQAAPDLIEIPVPVATPLGGGA
jgi:hypothetical protein